MEHPGKTKIDCGVEENEGSQISTDTDIAERKGVAAILALQALRNISETPEQAKEGWRRMSVVERAKTMWAASVFLPTKIKN